MRVIVQGRLKSRSYETREGEKRTVFEVDVDEIGPCLRYATAQVTRTTSGGSGGSWQGKQNSNNNGGDSWSSSGGGNNRGGNDPWAQSGNSNGGGDAWGQSAVEEPPF